MWKFTLYFAVGSKTGAISAKVGGKFKSVILMTLGQKLEPNLSLYHRDTAWAHEITDPSRYAEFK